MKKVKLFVWMILLIILETTVTRYLRIDNTVPALTYAFLICVAVRDENFPTVVLVGGICGVLGGSLLGKSFHFIFMFYTLSAAAVFYLRKKPRYTHSILKAVFWCGILTALYELGLYALENKGIDFFTVYAAMLPSALYNIATVLILYPLVSHTVYNKDVKKKLIA